MMSCFLGVGKEMLLVLYAWLSLNISLPLAMLQTQTNPPYFLAIFWIIELILGKVDAVLFSKPLWSKPDYNQIAAP